MTVLTGHELVVHVFLAADRVDPSDERDPLRLLWKDGCERIGVPAAELPGSLTAAGPGGLLGQVRGPDPGVHQVVLRRVDEVVVLSTVRAPDPAGPHAWHGRAGLPDPGTGVIGAVQILQACSADPGRPDVAALAPEVATAAGDVGWSAPGAVVDHPTLGSFAVWEADDPAGDRRGGRCLAVVAPAGRDRELSTWTWSGGGFGMPPLASYLMEAAELRHLLRESRLDLRAAVVRGESEQLITRVAAITGAVRDNGRLPDPRELDAISVPLLRLQAEDLGLLRRAAELRARRHSVSIATRNMAAFAGDPHAPGPFADDRDLARWLDRELDNEATRLDLARQQTVAAVALTDQLVQRGLQQRQERVTLVVTTVIGAVLMALAAIQSLDFTVPIADPLKPPAVAMLTAGALLLPAVALPYPARSRRWLLGVVVAAGALFGATSGWLLGAVVSWAVAAPVEPIGVAVAVGTGALLGAGATALRLRPVPAAG